MTDEEFDALMNEICGDLQIKTFERRARENPKTYFPSGLKWKYYSAHSRGRRWMFCYSSGRNGNGKFLSWVYQPKGSKKKITWKSRKIVEHRTRKKAIVRALKLYKQFNEKQRARREKGNAEIT